MKKATIFVIGIAILASLLGCQIPGVVTEGSLRIIVDNEINSKTLLPSLDIEPASYRITGTGPEGAVFDANTTADEVTIGFLRFGDWTINIEAFNAEGALIAAGTADTTVHVEAVTPVNITIRLLDGTGTFNLSVSWLQNEVENANITGVLKSTSGSDITLTFNDAEGDIGTENVFADTGNTIPVGYYTLVVTVSDLGASGSANHLALGAVEIARILKNQTTYGNYNLRGVPGMGKVDVNITQDFDDPIDISLSAIPFVEEIPTTAEYDSGAYLTLGANVSSDDEDAANITYVWYLNGETVGVDDNYTIDLNNSPLSTNINGKYAPGHYRLDVTAFNADGSRAGSAHFEFDVTGNPGQVVPTATPTPIPTPTATPTPASFVVNIPDPVLETRIRSYAGVPEGDIYNTDLEAMTSLGANGSGSNKITDLTGLEYCTNLTLLQLSSNQISDFTALRSLKNLERLTIESNGITDISFIEDMPKLRLFRAGSNQISDISPLQGKTTIDDLYLEGNQIGDFTPISSLVNLNSLVLSNTGITNLSFLSGLTKLTALQIGSNSGLTSLTGLESHADLFHLNIDHTGISDLTPLGSLTKLKQLYASWTNLTSLDGLAGHTNLSTLMVPYCTVSDISAIAGLTNITKFIANDNNITDISAVSNKTKLSELNLNKNSITYISALTGNTALQLVYLSDNLIDDITALSGLTNLSVVTIMNNGMILATAHPQGVTNMNVVNQLVADGVNIYYETGNILTVPQ